MTVIGNIKTMGFPWGVHAQSSDIIISSSSTSKPLRRHMMEVLEPTLVFEYQRIKLSTADTDEEE
jgi:hypothetical protein